MRTFQPGSSFWPRLRFLVGNSKDESGASMKHRRAERSSEVPRPETVRQIVEAHHDRNAQTLGPSR